MSETKERFIIEIEDHGYYEGMFNKHDWLFDDDIDSAKLFKSEEKAIKRAKKAQNDLIDHPRYRIISMVWVSEQSISDGNWRAYVTPEEIATPTQAITLASLGIMNVSELQKKNRLTKLQFTTLINIVLNDAPADSKPSQTDLNNWWDEYQADPSKYDWIK